MQVNALFKYIICICSIPSEKSHGIEKEKERSCDPVR